MRLGALGVVVSLFAAACGDDSTVIPPPDAPAADAPLPVTPRPCGVNTHVVAHACVACAPGSTNAAGDEANGADTACDTTLCAVNQHVAGHACVACAPGSTNAAGNDATGADTTCTATLCPADQRVASHACVACVAGSTNAAGDDASGADTACDAEVCALDQHVVGHACVACAAGSTNAGGDDATGADTTCDGTLCLANQRVATHACTPCAPGSTNGAGDDASGADTTCDATLCPANQRVVAHACVACGAGSTNTAGDDATGADTMCDPTLCPANQRVAGNACVACPPGTTNAAGDNASGADTTCDVTLCALDQRVAGNACVACAPGTTNAAGDDASGADTTCDLILCAVDQRVLENACVACPAGETNLSGDDASGGDTACDPIAILRISEVAPNQSSSRDLVELQVLAAGTLRDIVIDQAGAALAVLPDVTVSAGQLVVIHLNPATGVTGELTSQTECTDAACYATAWDVNGGTTGITFTRRVISVIDPFGDNQDVAAFTNLGTTPASYLTELQAVQTSGDWLPATCGGNACTDATTPTANDVSIDWNGVGTAAGSASVQRRSTVDTDTKADWTIASGTFGVLNPGQCPANQHVVANACVPCPVGQSNLAGDDPSGPDTACDLVAILRLTEVAPNQASSRDLVELVVLAGGSMRGLKVAQDGSTLATLPDVMVSPGQVIVVHLNPAAGPTTELTTQTSCTDLACYAGAWDVTGGTTAIAFTRRVISVIDVAGDIQDAVAFTNNSVSPTGYPTVLQGVQASGDWLPATCGGGPCTDTSTPTANNVSVVWTGVGTTPGSASVQRIPAIDSDSKADWAVAPQSFGVAPP